MVGAQNPRPMKSLLLLLLAFSLTIRPSAAQQPRIVGGTPAPAGAFPWMTAVVYKAEPDHWLAQFAGGALIHPRWILTAAHIVEGEAAADLQVIVGATDLDASGLQRINVLEIVRHPLYLPTDFEHDVALLLLETPVTGVAPLEIISDPALVAAGTLTTTMGWGSYSEGENDFGGPVLRQVEVPVVDQDLANSADYHDGQVSDNMLAAGIAAGGKDTCAGDSGGPLVIRGSSGQWVQAGIVSWGDGCGRPMKPGVYTRLSRYRQWVQTYVWPNFSAWEVAAGITSDDGPDKDGDGATQWEEYARRRNPLVPDAPGFLGAGLTGLPPNHLPTLTLHRPAGGGDIAWGLAHSVNLLTWTPLDPAAQQVGVPVAVPGDAGAEAVTWRGPGGTTSSFLRASHQPGGEYYRGWRPLLFSRGVTHALHSGDVLNSGLRERDYLLLDLPAGQSVTLTLRSSAFNAVLHLLNADTGETLASSTANTGGGNDEKLIFTADAALRYLARVTTQAAGTTGEFSLAAFRIPPTVPVISGAQSLTGSLDPADPVDPFFPGGTYFFDDFAFTAPSNSAVTVYLTSANFDPDFAIINAETGQRIITSTGLQSFSLGGINFAGSAMQTFVPRAGVTYYLRASSATELATGGYTIRTVATTSITPGTTRAGSLVATDGLDPYWVPDYAILADDYILASAPAGVVRTVTLTSATLDTVLEVLDAANGASIAWNDDANDATTDSALSFTPVAGHSYIIRVSQYDEGPTGSYSLRVQ
jgi:hypothetical protein